MSHYNYKLENRFLQKKHVHNDLNATVQTDLEMTLSSVLLYDNDNIPKQYLE